ncbi:MAG: hypothetical protein RR705_03065 [Lachnospiraceae bacterium]
MKNNIPLTPIEPFSLEESQYVRGNEIWKATTLIDYCKAKGYKPFDLPLAGIDLSTAHFTYSCTATFIFQMKRVQNSDLTYPIILDDFGQIADGCLRICKAILEGKTTIKAIRMEDMPAYDKWEENKD